MPRFRNNNKKNMKKKVRSNTQRIGKLEAGIERKQSNSAALVAESIDTAGDLTQLSNINEGLTFQHRIGEVIHVRTIMIRGVINNSTITTPQDALVRLLVFKNSVPNGVTQAITGEVLDTIAINSMRDWSKKEMYKVYYDQTFFLDTSTHSKIPFKIRISGLNSKCTFEGSGAGEADAMTNHFYFAMFSDKAAGDSAPLMDATFRITYDDS